jgi:SAM-dependent methyltransferase
MSQKQQARYFENVDYRGPMHPVVQAYVHPKIAYIQETIGLDPHWSVLDVGCGNGIFTHPLGEICPDIVGLDYSEHLLAENPKDELVRGDATTLPFRDESFDVVFEANILHHVQKRLSVVSEMNRVSKKYVVLLEPNRYNPLMLGLSLVVAEERGVLQSSLKQLKHELRECGLEFISAITTGMISQNNTPLFLTPMLKRFDRQIWWGEYIITIAKKPQVASWSGRPSAQNVSAP